MYLDFMILSILLLHTTVIINNFFLNFLSHHHPAVILYWMESLKKLKHMKKIVLVSKNYHERNK